MDDMYLKRIFKKYHYVLNECNIKKNKFLDLNKRFYHQHFSKNNIYNSLTEICIRIYKFVFHIYICNDLYRYNSNNIIILSYIIF